MTNWVFIKNNVSTALKNVEKNLALPHISNGARQQSQQNRRERLRNLLK
jgi:hypothetical protein